MPLTGELLTTAEAARELGLAPASIRRAIANGVLQVIRLDERTNVVTRAEVERYRRENLGKRGRPRQS